MKSNYSDEAVRSLADAAFAQLKKYGTAGLPSHYNGVSDYLYDFYPDLPWDYRMIEALQIILDNPEFETVRQQWLSRFNFDLLTEFQKSIEEDKKELGLA